MWLLSALSLRECNETIGYIELKPTINFLKLPVLVLASVPRRLVLAAPSSATDLHPFRMRRSECQVHGGGPDSSIADRVEAFEGSSGRAEWASVTGEFLPCYIQSTWTTRTRTPGTARRSL
ncbi:hypothetical protein L226DRAFT_255911 [Lentinus tigrinus ALCF2SS1-7]|uniref:uncharacterized protein n=1 Tax=Lentinus tigrinus ALCF2SS1-7 TaxID=1328758 RepID=UPI001165F027|nr:hypothetical protein L226DRAFT_255911 [Lentinus tigrinus ALCF2SS1-7]